MNNIEILKEKIIQANEGYRIGNSIMSDSQFDILIDELENLSPNDELLSKIGHKISDKSRKRKLPIEMASMSKVKSVDEIFDWLRLKKIPLNTEFVITPKYDGLSFCVNELTNEAWTRGDGEYGQKSDIHYKSIGNKLKSNKQPEYKYSYGEVMIPKQTFIDKYSIDFANPRNLMAGLINSKEISDILKDSVYIKYGATESLQTNYTKKSDILDYLNKHQEIKVPYKIVNFNDLLIDSVNDYLVSLFHKWSKDFEIDGLVIEVNENGQSYGRETSTNNPVWARAFKSPVFEQSAKSEVLGISWNISKNNLLKPIIHIKPVKLDGVTVSNVTGNNAKFIKDNGIGTGAILEVKRSGMVIPKVIKIIKKVNFKIPTIEGVEIGWNENEIELVALTETDDQKIKQIISFFEILNTDEVKEGVIKELWDAGHKTIKDILNLKVNDLEKINRFGERKSEIVYNSIKKSITNVQLSKLQHASNLFKGLGSRKLALLEHFKSKPSYNDIISINGFSEISAKSYLEAYDKFKKWVKDLPITIKEKTMENKKTSTKLEGKSFVFTGFRSEEYQNRIEELSGKVSSSVSKNTSFLVMKEKNTGTIKENKALELGVTILTREELEEMIF